MQFDWDKLKAEQNYQKHGVTFDEASTVFGDLFALTEPDPEHSLDEDRERTIGMSHKSRTLFVITTDRDDETGEIKRIISARKANTQELNAYADHVKSTILAQAEGAEAGGGQRRRRRGS